MELGRLSASCVLLFGLVACHGESSGGGSISTPLLTNVGIGAAAMKGSSELWLLAVSEQGDGGGDRNADGDADDIVAVVYDLAHDSLTELGRSLGREGGPLPLLAVGDVLAAFGVSEADDESDENGDGDTDDVVLHVYDSRTRATTSTRLAAAALEPAIGGGTVAFAVSEAAQDGQDLDGDGTAIGFVLHVYDSRTGLTTNAQRSVTSPIRFHDHSFSFTTAEAAALADLNGDGDQTDDAILEFYDLIMGGIESTPLAVRGRPLAVEPDEYYVLVDELQQGLDLNGDGDTDDGVLHEVAPHLHTHESLELSSAGSFGSTTSGLFSAFVVQEIDGLDRNGDGDTLDSFVAVHDEALDETVVPPVAIVPSSPLVFAGGSVAFLASESDQELDLNGDGDELDQVVHLWDTVDGLLTNAGIDALDLQSPNGWLILQLSEATNADWNEDGDELDVVAFLLDPLFGGVSNTRLANAGGALGVDGNWLVLAGSEAGEGQDLNGDHDLGDRVLVLHDTTSITMGPIGIGQSVSLRLALAPGASSAVLPDGRAVFLVSEPDQGVDLNLDGDLDDAVLHRMH